MGTLNPQSIYRPRASTPAKRPTAKGAEPRATPAPVEGVAEAEAVPLAEPEAEVAVVMPEAVEVPEAVVVAPVAVVLEPDLVEVEVPAEV